MYDLVRTQAPDKKGTMRWFGGSLVLAKAIKDRLAQAISARTNGVLALPTCTYTSTWLSRRVLESMSTAFKPLREWLPVRWDRKIEAKKRVQRSIALF